MSRLQVPGRPNLAFTGQVGDLWWVFVLMGLSGYAGLYDDFIQLLMIPLQGFLSWTLLRWLASRLTSNGQPLPIAFNGSVLTFIGWQILLVVSFITIIGWAWVATAWMRWICRNVEGTRREIVFKASGLDVLWRTHRVRDRLLLHHSDSMGDALVQPTGTCRNSNWSSAAR